MVDLASAVVAGAGLNAGQIFKEIGADAPAFYSVGAIKLLNGDPLAAEDVAEYTAAAHDKDASRDLPKFTNPWVFKKLGDPLGTAGVGLGMDATGRVRDTANILMGARAMREGKDPKNPESDFDDDYAKRAYTLALGGTYDKDGTQFGGIASRGSAWRPGSAAEQNVIVPGDMKASEFDNVLSNITNADLKALPNPPSDKTGHMIDANILAKGQLYPVPDKSDGLFHGRYTVSINHGGVEQPVLNPDGRGAWVLDLNQNSQLGATLRERYPGSFIPKGPPRAPNSPSPYKGIPGMAAPDTTGASVASASLSNEATE